MAERKHKHATPKESPVEESLTPEPVENEDDIIPPFRKRAAGEKAGEDVVSKKEFEALQQTLVETEGKAKEYFDGWQRERADFANYKRRVDRDQANLSQNIAGEIIKKYLMVLDDMDRAMKHRPTDGSAAAWADGIDLIYRKLQNILTAEGIQRIPAENEDFDPLRHEAISIEESENHTSGQIIGVVQEGYILGDRVLRPARVRVAR